MIIDSHVHLPQLGNPQKWDYMLQEAGKNEINLMIASHLGDWSAYPTKRIISEANIAAREFADYAQGRVLWLAYLNPQLGNWREELNTCVENGACGIKLWISLKDSNGSLDNTIAVLKEATKLKLPVLLHTYFRTDGNLTGEIAMLEFAKLSLLFPNCVMIAAHSGGNWRQSLGLLKECSKNAYLDICGGYPDSEMVETLSKHEGADRLLFGSDALGRSFASQAAKVVFSNISEEMKEQIFWKNAAKIYKIKVIPPLIDCKNTTVVKSELSSLAEEHFCFCGTWPFWESTCKTPKALNRILIENKIQQAYVGDLNSLFRSDLFIANSTFLNACKGLDRIVPLAILNPLAHNWRQVILEAAKNGFTGGLVSPYLHCWQLDHPAFDEFFKFCAENKLKIWINCDLVDHRLRHNALTARQITAAELTEFMRKAPDNQYVFQGINSANVAVQLELFNEDERFFFEFSRLTDKQDGLQEVIKRFGGKRIVAGSEFPFRDIKQTRYVIDSY